MKKLLIFAILIYLYLLTKAPKYDPPDSVYMIDFPVEKDNTPKYVPHIGKLDTTPYKPHRVEDIDLPY